LTLREMRFLLPGYAAKERAMMVKCPASDCNRIVEHASLCERCGVCDRCCYCDCVTRPEAKETE
jgi:hypothetical protein